MSATAALVIVILLQILLIVIILPLIIRAIAQVLSDMAGIPFVRTPSYAFPKIAAALRINDTDTVYELGSGDGAFLLWCAQQHPGARYVGIELNPLLIRYARWRQKRLGLTNVIFIKGDLFEADFSAATKIYAYILPKTLAKLRPLLDQQFHGRFASRAFPFKDLAAESVITLTERKGSHNQHLVHMYDF